MNDKKRLRYTIGDATKPQSSSYQQVIAHCVNDLGLWGAGFTAALDSRYPEARASYLRWASPRTDVDIEAARPFKLGVCKTSPLASGESVILIAHLMGQTGVGRKDGPSIRYEHLRSAMEMLAGTAKHLYDCTIHMPRIGCGLAGGTWDKVEPIIRETLCAEDLDVTIYDLPDPSAGNWVALSKDQWKP